MKLDVCCSPIFHNFNICQKAWLAHHAHDPNLFRGAAHAQASKQVGDSGKQNLRDLSKEEAKTPNIERCVVVVVDESVVSAAAGMKQQKQQQQRRRRQRQLIGTTTANRDNEL